MREQLDDSLLAASPVWVPVKEPPEAGAVIRFTERRWGKPRRSRTLEAEVVYVDRNGDFCLCVRAEKGYSVGLVGRRILRRRSDICRPGTERRM